MKLSFKISVTDGFELMIYIYIYILYIAISAGIFSYINVSITGLKKRTNARNFACRT